MRMGNRHPYAAPSRLRKSRSRPAPPPRWRGRLRARHSKRQKEVPIGTILVATDGSAAGTAALTEAIELAKAMDDRLLVVTVWRPLQGDFGLPYSNLSLSTELIAAERERAERTLAEAKAEAERVGLAVETVLRSGDPAGEICAVAASERARLLVIGSPGHGAGLSVLLRTVSRAAPHH